MMKVDEGTRNKEDQNYFDISTPAKRSNSAKPCLNPRLGCGISQQQVFVTTMEVEDRPLSFRIP